MIFVANIGFGSTCIIISGACLNNQTIIKAEYFLAENKYCFQNVLSKEFEKTTVNLEIFTLINFCESES